MDEINGFNIAVKVLGERIAQLESEARYERIMKEDAVKKLEVLAAENTKLAKMLEKVQHFIERTEE